MKTKNVLIILLVLLAAGVGVFFFKKSPPVPGTITAHSHKNDYYCPMHPQYTSDRPGICPICQMKLVKKEGNPQAELQQMTEAQKEKKILYWTDPMIPGYKAEGPGKSPMGMDLIPVYEESPQNQSSGQAVPEYTTVSLTPQKQQLIGIKTMKVERKDAVKIIRALGRVTTNHDLYILQDEYVKAYTKFVKTYRDYRRVEHLSRNWETHRELQLKLHEAEDQLLRLGLGPNQIEKLRNVSWTATWRQPELLFLKDSLQYWVTAQIYEGDLGFVEVGEEADIEIPSYRESAKGIVRSVGGTVDPETRTTYALIELTGYRGELKGNMFVNAVIHVPLSEVIIVPRDAVMDTGLRKVVFVQKGDGIFEPRDIQTNWTTDDGYEVKSGLHEGETIVVSGNFLLDSESRMQASLAGGQ